MIIGTIESRALCKKIAKLTDTIVMGYSRGKDTLAAVVWTKLLLPTWSYKVVAKDVPVVAKFSVQLLQ